MRFIGWKKSIAAESAERRVNRVEKGDRAVYFPFAYSHNVASIHFVDRGINDAYATALVDGKFKRLELISIPLAYFRVWPKWCLGRWDKRLSCGSWLKYFDNFGRSNDQSVKRRFLHDKSVLWEKCNIPRHRSLSTATAVTHFFRPIV